MSDTQTKTYYTISDLARMLGWSERMTYYHVRQTLRLPAPSIKMPCGRREFYNRDQIDHIKSLVASGNW